MACAVFGCGGVGGCLHDVFFGAAFAGRGCASGLRGRGVDAGVWLVGSPSVFFR